MTGTTGMSGTSGMSGTTGTTGTGSVDPAGLPLGVTPQGLVHGHHTTVTGEKLDPHVGSGMTGTGITTSGTTGMGHSGTGSGLTGTSGSNTTSGPHSSNLANKMDPRVDSDRDGSKLH